MDVPTFGSLIDPDEVFVAKDFNGLVRCIGQVCTNDQGRLEQRPSREVRLGFLVGKIANRIAGTGIANFHDVHIVAPVEVRRPVVERSLINNASDRIPPRLNVSIDTPRLCH